MTEFALYLATASTIFTWVGILFPLTVFIWQTSKVSAIIIENK